MINHMEIEISKLGERGQIVIPQEIRDKLNMKKGEKFIMLTENEDIIIRQVSKLKSNIEEDLIDMKKADRIWGEIEKGKFRKFTKEEFEKEMESW